MDIALNIVMSTHKIETTNHEFKDFRYTCERLNTEAETKRLQHEVF